MGGEDKVMNFFVIKRRETGDYVADDDGDTTFVSFARRYTTRKKAVNAITMLDLRTSTPRYPNTCVCGPYSTDHYGGQPG